MPARRVTYPPRRKLSVPMVARQIGVADQKVLKWIKTGELRAVNLATSPHNRPRYSIDVDDLEAFERSRQVIPESGLTSTRRLRRRAASDVKDYFPHLS